MPKPAFHGYDYRVLVTILHDGIMAALSFVLAVYLRLGEAPFQDSAAFVRYGVAMFVPISLAAFASMRLYRGLWRYASMRDLVAVTKGATLAVIVFAAALFLVNRLEGVPRSVLFIHWMLLLLMIGAPRFIYRALKDRTLRWSMSLKEGSKIPVLLIGVNDNSERFIRDMARDQLAPYEAVAIVDDRPKRRGRSIHHVPIIGGVERLEEIVRQLRRQGKQPQKIILTDAGAPGEAVRQLLALADGLGIPLARLPKPGDIKAGVSDKRDVQPIAVEDLLGRPQNVLDRESMRRLIEGKTVLVTGAGGTIGGELSRQIAGLNPARLLLLDAGEFNLYQIEREIGGSHPGLPLAALLANVRDRLHIGHLFQAYRPQLVFHAAALKHVPLSEANPEEAVLTNALGTENVARAAIEHGAGAMVMISTDKAVNPTNIMGASKRLAEMLCQGLSSLAETNTQFITVRFGNVLGSTGSVVPLFQEQLAKGGPLTVTHPEITRYFMTTREAVELVLQAAALGAAELSRRGQMFVLDMGTPVKILDLAQQMIRLAGMKPGEDIDVVYTGLRPGEKLHEELFYFSENAAKKAHESIYLASPPAVDMAFLKPRLDGLYAAAQARDTKQALALLKGLVPEYVPSSH